MVARSWVEKKQAGSKEKEALLKVQPHPCGYLLTLHRSRGKAHCFSASLQMRDRCEFRSRPTNGLLWQPDCSLGGHLADNRPSSLHRRLRRPCAPSGPGMDPAADPPD